MHKRYKTALITGAASGIGYSILKKLSNYKFKIYALDKNKIKLNLQQNNIHLCGRFAEWKYYNIDNCIEASMKVCDKI